MDPTTFLTAVLIAIGFLGADAVMYSGSVVVDIAPPPKVESIAIDKATIDQQFQGTLNDIARTKSLVRPFEIRPSSDVGIGMALAEAAGVKEVATALEGSVGANPDRLRFALYTDGDQVRGLVSGSSHTMKNFQTVMTPAKGEPMLAFVRRCALWGASELAPYSTALYLLQLHASDKNFDDVVALSEHVKSLLPPSPRNPTRALFDNVLGLVALFKNDKQGARDAFERAMQADPTDPVPFLNAAFTDLQFDEFQTAATRMHQLIQRAPPENPVLLATAYMTLGAALMGEKDLRGADQALATAVRDDPHSATAWQLWSEEKGLADDRQAAAKLHAEALIETATFENYAEVAALYFHLSWGINEPVTLNQFSNPGVVSFH